METRILIPNGLKLIVTDSEVKSDNESSKLSKSNIIKLEDDSEEKPSSSSGHCETPEDDQNHFQPKSRKCKEKRDSSTCEEDDDLWKKEQKSRFTTFSSSTSSTSTMSPATMDSSSSSSDNEVDVDYFVKARQKSENAISGITRNSLECKKSPSSTRKQECDDVDDKMNATGDKNLNNYNNQVKICATRVIEKGTVFTPNDGDIQVAHLKGIQPIPKDDIRFIFGCFETFTPGQLSPRISPSPASDPLFSPASTTATSPPPMCDPSDQSGSNCNFVRLCNWIRFLRRNNSLRNVFNTTPQPKKFSKSEDNDNWNNDRKMDSHQKRNIFQTGDISESDWPNSTNDLSKKSFLTTTNTPGGTSDKSHNMIARFEEGRPMFEVTERLVPGTELVAHFDMNSVFKSTSSISPYMTMMMSTLPNMLAKTAEATTPSSPPAPSSSSTLISSSSPPTPGLLSFGGTGTKTGTGNVGLGVKKERDEKELLQHHHQRLIMPAYPYSFYDNYASLENKVLFSNNTQTFNAFRFGDGNNAQFGKEGKRINAGIKQEFPGAHGIADGPLDLSKFPSFNKSHLESFHEPLKIGTPFDSPDSNDDDQTKRMPSPSVKCEEENSSMFSIKNVLKPKSSVPPCKLFQPYSLEIGKKSPDKDAFMRALISSNPSSVSNTLGTAPRSEFPLTGRNASGLRPILRTRGRERSLLPCEVCGKAFDRPSLLKRHLRTHTGEKPHICDVCTKGFSTSSSLNTHRRIHSGEKPHQCPICGKRFTASSNLYYHRMTHNKEKPHKCMLCGKSFPTPGDLKSHQYVHSGSWPYTCHVCHRGFSKQTNLRNHLLLHSGMTNNAASSKPGDKPHTCQVCGQKFAQACNLRAHLKTHEESDSSSSTLTSSCSVCKRTFLPTSEMLLNGRCRSCQLRIPNNKTSCSDHSIRRDSISTSPAPNPCINPLAVGKVKEGFTPSYDNHTATATSLLSQRFLAQGNASQQQLASSISSLNLPLAQFPGLSLPGLTNALAFPTNVAPLHFSLNVNPTASNHTDLLSSSSTQSTTRNTLFDTLVEWNYRMAKESVGLGSLSLGLMQQKLLESQSRMIANQFMSSHGFGMGGGIQDILSLRPAMNPEGFSGLDPVVSSESKYLQR